MNQAPPAKRIKLFQPATLVAGDAAIRVHLLDISLTGALAHTAAPPPPHCLVRIDCAGVSRTARVCWREGARFGLHFDQPLRPHQLHALAPALPGTRSGAPEPCALA